ncbi:MAG: Zn-dependent protease [Proteobacteria bacterium]|nr:MAG: Zn-dependent protease [Pseudomonadota bacterium]
MTQPVENTLVAASEQVFERANAAGADADLIVLENESLSLKANEGELEEHTVSNTRTFGVRVIKDNKVGIAYSEAGDQESLVWMVDQALQNATFSTEEPHEKILNDPQSLRSDDAIFCPQDDSTVEEKIDMVLALEQGLLDKALIKSAPYNGVAESFGSRYIFSSAGLDAASRSRMVYAYAYALAEDGEKNAMKGTGQMSRLTCDLNIPELVETVADLSLNMLEGRPVPSKHYDVIFDRECQVGLFSVFTMVLSGKAAKDGINPWREKLGQQVADSRLQLWDKPRLMDGFGYSLFDDEGTATMDVPFIVDGMFQNMMHNSVTASHFGVKTTGHASRGVRSPLGVGHHQLFVEQGEAGQAELLAGDYLEVTSMQGLHSGANPISGDFSLGAAGYLCRDGQRIQPVRGITVAGNFYKMLNHIACIGDETYWNWQRSACMPAIRFADLAISGE